MQHPSPAFPPIPADGTPPPPAPRTFRGHQTRGRILQNAVKLFARHDYDAVSLREITGSIELNTSLVKFHFGGKEALYLEAIRYAGQVGLEEVRRLPQAPPPEAPHAAEGGIRALQADIEMFIMLGRAVKQSAGPSSDTGLRTSAMTLLGRALGSPQAETRQAIQGVLEAQRSHLDGCLLALRPDLSEDARFLLGAAIAGQGLLFFLYPSLVDGTRNPGAPPASPSMLVRQLTQFCLAGIRHFPA